MLDGLQEGKIISSWRKWERFHRGLEHYMWLKEAQSFNRQTEGLGRGVSKTKA